MTILVTGATSGIGLEAATTLAKRGADVALVGRSEETAERAAATVRLRAGGRAAVSSYNADLSRRAQVEALAEAVQHDHPNLRGLVLCAAVANPEVAVTEGVDTTLAVNHLAPVLLTRLLDASLRGGRIVLLTSSQHRAAGAFDPATFDIGGPVPTMRRYEATKLLGLLFVAARLRRPHVAPLEALDPGFVRTALGRNAQGMFRLLLALTRPLQSSPDVPGRLIADRLAADDFQDGGFRGLQGPAKRAPNAQDVEASEAAWAWTERLLAS